MITTQPSQGNEDYAAPILPNDPTIGYHFNHVMLRIRDPNRSLRFYVDLMGMRIIFKRDVGPITVYYLGYPQTPAHRQDPVAYAEEASPHSTLTSTLGLLELCHYHGTEKQPESFITTGNEPPHLGFNHLGFTVPDVRATMERLRKNGVVVAKEVDQGPTENIPITRWEREEKSIATQEFSAAFEGILKQIAFVQDPDGYFIELVPQTLSK